ncbi:hypothetical protein O181_007348 [Austropuccinia psidii MF-1]|uniref:Uncharacterized protein n=1 Tax=Austropuccinia psidii MF-1 TaxID=1389203 RepID=A0A9Q3GHH0_9BASI|nr:hypothetical protein [Austropuccinia psidii MF-1]
MLRKNRPEFAIGEEALGKIRGHDIELYLDVERPCPPMLRRPPYPASLETREEIEKHVNEFLSQGRIWKQEGLALRNQELTWRAPKDIRNNKE